METSLARDTSTPANARGIGRVVAINGSQATAELSPRAPDGENPTVGKFMGLLTGKSIIVGLITDVGEQPLGTAAGSGQAYRKVARLDLIGEIGAGEGGAARFQRGVTEYPNIGDGAMLLGERELKLV